MARFILKAIAMLAILGGALSAGIKEPKGSKVSVLNKDLFPRFMSRNPLVLMEFYAPWCGHCQELAPKYREAAAKLASMRKELPTPVKFAKLDDSDEYNREARFGAEDMFNFSAYPALFVFKDGKMDHPYWGGREVDDMVFYMSAVSKGLDPEEEEMKLRPGLYKGKTDVVPDLEVETFDDFVLKPNTEDNRLVIVEFYSDRCPFCKSLSEEVIKATEMLKDEEPRAKVGAINSRIFEDVAERFEVTGWPWVAAFYNGRKVQDMAGLGGAQTIVDFAKRMVDEYWTSDIQAGEGAPMEATITQAGDGITSTVDDGPVKRIETLDPSEVKRMVESVTNKDKRHVDDDEDGQVVDDKSARWRADLGRRTWFLLHTMAAKYPDLPSEVDMRTMRNFIAALGQHYPCKLCRKHLREKLQRPSLGPVAVESRQALSQWMCKLHNIVNADTGKPEHSCDAFQLDLKYLKDCGECEPGKPVTGEAAAPVHDTFDARLYAKDETHFLSEMHEAMDALSEKVSSLEDENRELKEQLKALGHL